MQRNASAVAKALQILSEWRPKQLHTGQAVLHQHAHVMTYRAAEPPDGVFFAESADEVTRVVAVCADLGVPIIPYGTGTSMEGHVNAPFGGVCLDMSRMNRIISVRPGDLDCTVQAGVTRGQLNEHLRDRGLFFPIDPGTDASLGGMAATRASGTNAVRYGTMRDNVVALRAILANSREIVTSRRAKKSSAGYDLTRLLVGSEGTLGIMTELTLRLYGIPDLIVGGVCAFPGTDQACRAVIETIQMSIPVARIELLNAIAMKAVNSYSNLRHAERPCLFVEFHGTKAGTEEQVTLFGEIAAEHGGGPFVSASTVEERAKLWKARHDAYWAGLALRPGMQGLSTDVCVPISCLAECISEAETDIARFGLTAPIVGHVGDGNFHVLIYMDPTDTQEIARVESFVERLTHRAIAMDGTCTGEHGVGHGKIPFLEQELGGAVDVMRTIKRGLDPKNILNPGKIFRMTA